MSQLTDTFLEAIRASYSAYHAYGARSPKKIKPAHQWLGDCLRERLGSKYEVHGLRQDDDDAREDSAPGLYYNKNIDIGVHFNGELVSGLGFKFVTSNYKQNSNNFFENMLGEIANIRRNNIVYGSLLVLPIKVPYRKKDGTVNNEQLVSTHDMEKYLNLCRDADFPHKPEAMGIVFVDLDYKKQSVSGLTDINKTEMSADIKRFLETEVGLNQFFTDFVNATKLRADPQ